MPKTPDWAEIPGFAGYEASLSGEIRNRRGKILKQRPTASGAARVDLGRASVSVHKLVLKAWTGRPLCRGFYPVHVGPRSDNSLENLAWAGKAR